MVDFKRKIAQKNKTRVTDPIELYNTLDRKSMVGPLRPAQHYALNEWYDNRKNDKDLIIKLHTGEGKTLIGLLILQSSLNMEDGPCVYVCPNRYLVDQVCCEAEKFGIPYCTIGPDNSIPNEFLSSEKILITNAHKIFNGKSIFGIENKYVSAGTVLLDDSHSCVDVIRDAFTVNITKKANLDVYNKILTLFYDYLLEQGEGRLLDIKSGEYDTYMLVPYWAWNTKKSELLQVLSKANSDVDSIKFVWPLLRDVIHNYSCYISDSRIEISPYNINVDCFGTFSKAKRRILMSATTQDDIFFIKGLNFSSDAVNNPIVDTKSRWSGEKMILMPSLIDERCDRYLVAPAFARLKTKKYGVVAIVPSTKSTDYYSGFGAECAYDTNKLSDIVNNLRNKKFEKTVVFNNRYDGIDLPDESCRILIIDSKPFLDNYSDKYRERCCPNSEIINKKIAQKIEQGLGRAVRGEKDYCAILILGSDIEKFMQSVLTKKYFSEQTQKQIEIGFEVAKMAKEELQEDDSPLKSISSLIKQLLRRDEGWKEYYKSEMDELSYNNIEKKDYTKYVTECNLEKLYAQEEYEQAAREIQSFIDEYIDDDLEKGWYLEQAARYTYMFSKEKSCELQNAAFKLNRQLLKPNREIAYSKISFINESRTNQFKRYMCKYSNFSEFSLHMNELLERLSFGVDAEKFESAVEELGDFLGYASQRPDKDYRKGPDNLWCVSNSEYVFFECKSQVEETRPSINKREAGQFNNHCGWFKAEYGTEVKVLRVMIIPTKVLAHDADFAEEVFVMRRNGLKKLKDNIRDLLKELKKYQIDSLSDERIQKYLDMYNLNIDGFKECYVEKIIHSQR